MTQEILEREENTEEPTEQPEKGADEGSENVEEPGPQAEGEVKPSLAEEEIATRVEKLAQQIAAKATQTLQDRVTTLTRENKEITAASRQREEEAKLAAKEGREIESWGDTPEARELHVERRAVKKDKEDQESWLEEVRDAYAIFQADSRENTALKLALQYGLPNGKELIKGLDNFIKTISEAKTDSEMELMAVKLSYQPKEKPEKKHITDSSIRSATGGIDINKLDPSGMLVHGFNEILKKK